MKALLLTDEEIELVYLCLEEELDKVGNTAYEKELLKDLIRRYKELYLQ